MIERKDVMPINFLKKENFTGSFCGMRYRMAKDTVKEGEEEKTVLTVSVWPEPYCYAATPEEQKTEEQFPFTEDGIVSGVEWLNGQHPKFL